MAEAENPLLSQLEVHPRAISVHRSRLQSIITKFVREIGIGLRIPSDLAMICFCVQFAISVYNFAQVHGRYFCAQDQLGQKVQIAACRCHYSQL